MNSIRIIFVRCAGFGTDRAVLVLLSSLFWVAASAFDLQFTIFQPSTASAQDALDGSPANEEWDQAWDTDTVNEALDESFSDPSFLEENQEPSATEAINPEDDLSNPASVQVPQEFIATWIDDLKQSTDRWIQVDLSDQRLTAWEGDRQVYAVTVSTGRTEEPTIAGVFNIQIKQEKAWMQGETYEIPNVPYTMYYSGNYAIHGTYWHNNFGTPVSNGCINVPIDQAAWLYNWAAIGTTVVIQP